jgi:hypothetical protein
MEWSTKYKKSIDCNNPKGFSQKAHCAGRKARQKGEKTKSKSVSEMKTQKNEVFGAADRFVATFFRGLERKAAGKIIKQAEKAKLPPDVIKLMKDIEDRSNELQDILKKVSK